MLSKGEESVKKLCEDIQEEYEKDNVKRGIDKENQTVLATLKRTSTAIVNMSVTDKTLLKKDKKAALTLIETLIKQIEEKEKEINKVKYQ